MNPIQDHDKNKEPADDEVGKIIWDRNPGREPEKEIPEDEDKDEDDTDENYRVPPVNDENVIHAPGYDPLEQRRWEEEEERQRKEKEEKDRKEYPRGIWQM